MAWNTQLAQPAENDVKQGRYTLCRFVRCEASVAKPVVWANVSGIQNVSIDEVSWGQTTNIHQQGAGDESLELRRDPMTTGSIEFLGGEAPTQIAALLGLTWTAAGTAAIPFFRESDYPAVTFELVVREDDNATHLYSVCYPDAIITGLDWPNPMEEGNVTIRFKTQREPFYLANKTEAVYDEFTGDGSTVAFTLSGTPVPLVTAANQRYWDYANFAYIKEKATGASTSTLMKSGYSDTGVTLTATTAPAASTVVQALYAKAQA